MQAQDPSAMSPAILNKLNKSRVIAVLFIDELKNAVPVATALAKGGVDIIELTLRTPIAFEAARLILQEVSEITVGLGTVLMEEQVAKAVDIGVDFAVSPGCNPKILRAAKDAGLSFAPGIAIPTDIEVALEHGCKILKYFPAEPLGGLKYLDSMAAPYMHLGISFIPLGGVNRSNARSYLTSSKICAIGGSWIANPKLIKAERWDTITDNARDVRGLIDDLR